MSSQNSSGLQKSWIEVHENHDFSLQNLPYGLFSVAGGETKVGVALGDFVIDLAALAPVYMKNELGDSCGVFASSSLNAFMAQGKEVWSKVRTRLTELLSADCSELRDNQEFRKTMVLTMDAVTLHMPVSIGNYVDFYSSIEHATNLGSMFRDPSNPLLPNWRHLPVGYNGRASSVILSGEPVVRPSGQSKADDAEAPSFGPCKLMDIELEVGFFAGTGNDLGTTISTGQAEDNIFGLVLVNDWSARDIQKWEYVPLGPFLGKSFATTISPWVIPLEALKPFRVAGPKQEPEVLPYLKHEGDGNIDLNLEIWLQTPEGDDFKVAGTNFRHMYWNMAQQVAHLTSNGANMCTGDLYASGTVSGTTPDSYGSLLELTWRGSKPIKLPSGGERKFLRDGDTITLRGFCQGNGYRVGFGECSGTIKPAR